MGFALIGDSESFFFEGALVTGNGIYLFFGDHGRMKLRERSRRFRGLGGGLTVW